MTDNEYAKIEKIKKEITGQVAELIEEHCEAVYNAMKAQENQIKLALSVNLKCTSEKCFVVSDINYTVLKIKDGTEGEIVFNQESLPGIQE